MNRTFTMNDLIEYAYNEKQMLDNVLIQDSIDNNLDTKMEFDSIVDVMSKLDEVKLEPSKDALSKILKFARNSQQELVPVSKI